MFCPKCGTKNEDGCNLCSNCGAELVDNQVIKNIKKEKFLDSVSQNINKQLLKSKNKAVEQLPRAKEKSVQLMTKIKELPKRYKILFLAVTVFVIIFIVLHSAVSFLCRPERIAEDFINAKINNEWGIMYSYLATEESDFINENNFSEMMESADASEVDSFEISDSSSPSSDLVKTYIVRYMLKNNSSTQTQTITLVKQNNFLFYDNYKVSADDLIIPEYQIHTLSGSTVYIDDIQLDREMNDDVEKTGSLMVYSIPNIFIGNHQIKIEHPECEMYVEQIELSKSSLKEYRVNTLVLKESVKVALAEKTENIFRQMISSALAKSDFAALNFPDINNTEAMEQIETLHNRLGVTFAEEEDETVIENINIAQVMDVSLQSEMDISGGYSCTMNIEFDEAADVSPGNISFWTNYVYENNGWNLLSISLDDMKISHTLGYTEIVPCMYDRINNFSEDRAMVLGGDGETKKWGVIDKEGNEIVPFKYDSVYDYSEGMAAVCVGDWENGKWGFIDKDGNEIIPCQYDMVSSFYEGVANITVGKIYPGSKTGLIDKSGTEIVPCIYDTIYGFRDNRAVVITDEWETGEKKFGIIDKNGTEIVPCQYDYIGFPPEFLETDYSKIYSEGMSPVLMGDQATGKWGFIDNNGNEVIPCKYDYVGGFQEDLAAVRVGDWETGKWGFINKEDVEVIPCIYAEVSSFSEGLSKVRIGRWEDATATYGLIDKSGNEIVPCKYHQIYDFVDDLAIVSVGDWENGFKYGAVNKMGEEVVEAKYDIFLRESYMEGSLGHGFTDEIIIVTEGEWGDDVKFGSINKVGELVIPYMYDWMYKISDSLMAVNIGAEMYSEGIEDIPYGGKWGFIDKDNKEVVPLKYDYVRSFSNGIAAVNIGIEIVTKEQPEAETNLYLTGGKWGFIDKDGTEIVPLQYDEVGQYTDGLVIVQQNGKSGIIAIE